MILLFFNHEGTEHTEKYILTEEMTLIRRPLEPQINTDKLNTLGRATWERQFPHWQPTHDDFNKLLTQSRHEVSFYNYKAQTDSQLGKLSGREYTQRGSANVPIGTGRKSAITSPRHGFGVMTFSSTRIIT